MSKKLISKSEESAFQQARTQLESVRELIGNHRQAEKEALNNEKEDDTENTREAIEQSALEKCVRSGWQPLGSIFTPDLDEYYILLCTGGPAVRIRGNLNSWDSPHDAILEYQDWGTPWIEYETTEEEKRDMLDYANCFEFEYSM